MIQFFNQQPVLASFLLSVAINLVFFAIAFTFKTDKVTDLSYSLSFFIMAPLLLLAGGMEFSLIQLVLTLAIMLWGLRLGSYLLRRILWTKTDARFDDKRNNPKKLIAFWTLQTLAIWIIMLPHSTFLNFPYPMEVSVWTYLGFFFFLSGFLIETISDQQKFVFKKKPENSDRWIDTGLWHFSRHPNYFGEMVLWWGLFLVVLPFLSSWQWLTLFGPLFITFLLLFVSGIPLLEKSAEEKYGQNEEYQQYRDSTSLLIPMIPRKKSS